MGYRYKILLRKRGKVEKKYGKKGMWYDYIKDMVLREGIAGGYLYRYYILLYDGTLVNYAPMVSRVRSVRIEFNPEKCDKRTIKFVKECIRMVQVNRIDVMCDIKDVNINDIMILDSKGLKKVYYKDGRGRLETIYYGSTKSDKRKRIYDKKKELQSKGIYVESEITRVEIQKRIKGGSRKYDEVIDGELYSDISIIRGDGYVGDLEMTALIYYLKKFPERISELSRYKRIKLLGKLESEIYDIRGAYLKIIDDLREKLRYYIESKEYVEVVEGFDSEYYIVENIVWGMIDSVKKQERLQL